MPKAALIVLFALALRAQTGPALTVVVNAGRHAINPGVYGMNWDWSGETSSAANASLAADIRATVRRWGGNNTSRYHWRYDVSNIDADWFFEVLPDSKLDASKLPEGSSFNRAFERWQKTGAQVMGTIPILGWLPNARARMCSFSVAKYGAQCAVDWWWHDCGNGVVYASGCPGPTQNDAGHAPQSGAQYIQNDPTDANAQFDESLQREWLHYLVSKYGKASQGGVAYWSLDNEPDWWQTTHRDIHPLPQTYDETLEQGLKYARAVKDADPTALVTGPVPSGWQSLFLSLKDIRAGWSTGPDWRFFNNQVDRNAHGGLAFVPWYLQKFRDAEQAEHRRLLDVLDVHAYIAPDGLDASPGSDAVQALRLRSTRAFWDANYTYSNYWVVDIDNHGAPIAPRLIPRLKEWIAQYYPGTQLAITEYNWGALDTLNGGLAQADILGIFGREGLDIGTLWATVRPGDPGAFAFRMYRNYDGIGGAFGETSVQAVSADPDQLAIYAALRSDSMLTVMVLNKTASDLSTSLAFSNFTPGAPAKVWRYSAENLAAILAKPDIPIAGGGISATFPAYSMTMLVVPPSSFAVPKPVVLALQNAASFDTARFAPGQMVVVWGSHLGPKDIVILSNLSAAQAFDANGLVRDTMAGVRILFDGVPGRMVYAREDTCAVVIPYFGATKATTHVQVEYQGVRSDPFEISLSATAPGLFTANSQGAGQGAFQVDANGTANSIQHPAHPDSTVVIWLTGEGVTDPPGVDGRLAIDILPKPVAQVTVEIGGLPARIEYAGAAPWNMPGLMQLNAHLDPAVQPGDHVPVRVKIGENWSQDNVTMVVR